MVTSPARSRFLGNASGGNWMIAVYVPDDPRNVVQFPRPPGVIALIP
jgi:hypothetical protein